MDYLQIQKHFEKAIDSYDQAAEVQLEVALFLLQVLLKLKVPHQRVLDLGSGGGLITEHLCRFFPIPVLHLADFSKPLLDKASRRLQKFQPEALLFNFDQEWPYKGLYDLIFSNMALQWSADIYTLFKRSRSCLQENGILGFSLPLKGTFLELCKHRVIPFHSFEDISKYLCLAGFKVLYSCSLSLCQQFKSYYHALQSIKKCGANSLIQKRSYKMIERSTLFLPTTLTYEVGIFVVRKHEE
jgi:malonyl-CoA O-methyltransferase